MGWPDISTHHLIPISIPLHLELPVASYPSHTPLLQSDLESQDKSSMPTISERFVGVKAAIVTDNSDLNSFAGKLGFSVLQSNQLINSGSSVTESSVDHVASELLKLLGFQDGKTLETSQFDLVFLHVGTAEKAKDKDTECVNGLVGGILHLAQPGSEISSRLHMSLVLSYGAVSEDDGSMLSVSITNPNHSSDFSLLFPRQSYTVRGSNSRENVRHHSPMLLAQWQSAVTRKDMVETFTFQDFKEHGGNLTIPADRFLHEVAFKLWKAPKYGA